MMSKENSIKQDTESNNVSYSEFGIHLISEPQVSQKKDENISFLRDGLLNKKYGIEIIETENNTEATAEPATTGNTPKKEFMIDPKNKVEILDSGPIREGDM